MHHELKLLISEQEIKKRITEIAKDIMNDYQKEPITMVCILKGGVMFMVDLARALLQDVEIDFIDVKSYENMQSTGIVRITKDLTDDIAGKHVIVVEDIIDSGRTLHYICNMLKERNPKSLKVCTLLDKPEQRLIETKVDYVGFVIPDEFVVGYGLDYDQKFRNLNYIAVLKPSK